MEKRLRRFVPFCQYSYLSDRVEAPVLAIALIVAIVNKSKTARKQFLFSKHHSDSRAASIYSTEFIQNECKQFILLQDVTTVHLIRP